MHLEISEIIEKGYQRAISDLFWELFQIKQIQCINNIIEFIWKSQW